MIVVTAAYNDRVKTIQHKSIQKKSIVIKNGRCDNENSFKHKKFQLT